MLIFNFSATLILALLMLSACSAAPAPLGGFEPAVATDTLSARNAKTLGWLTVCGQPSEADLRTLAATGTACVINMRTADEMLDVEFDEGAVVEALGMRYLHLPVSGVDSLTDQFFAEAREGLRECSAEGVLMH
jgi:hypothetical protein